MPPVRGFRASLELSLRCAVFARVLRVFLAACVLRVAVLGRCRPFLSSIFVCSVPVPHFPSRAGWREARARPLPETSSPHPGDLEAAFEIQRVRQAERAEIERTRQEEEDEEKRKALAASEKEAEAEAKEERSFEEQLRIVHQRSLQDAPAVSADGEGAKRDSVRAASGSPPPKRARLAPLDPNRQMGIGKDTPSKDGRCIDGGGEQTPGPRRP